LAAAGPNLRLILNTLRLLFARFLTALLGAVAKPDTWPRLPGIQKSIGWASFRIDALGSVDIQAAAVAGA
jgi:hypothetical protein